MLAPALRIFSKSPGATVLAGLYSRESEEKRLRDTVLLGAKVRGLSLYDLNGTKLSVVV
jgi:hypothetical protein